MDEHRRNSTPPSATDALWLAYVQTAQVPLAFTTSCWNAMIDMLWPIDPSRMHAHPDHRLPVPEALEEDPAPGLFA